MVLPLVVPSWVVYSAGLSVSPPFYAVWVVMLGLFSVRSRKFACFLASCAYAMCLVLKEQQGRVKVAEDVCNTANPTNAEGVRRYLVFGIGSWMSTFLFSAYVAKALYRILPNHVRTSYVGLACVGLLLYNKRAGGAETSDLYSVTYNSSIRFFFQCSLLLESARAALQVAFILSGANVRRHKAHVLSYSALILVHDILSVHFSGVNPYDLDILLQILLILCVWLNDGEIQHQRAAVNGVAQQPEVAHPPEVAHLPERAEQPLLNGVQQVLVLHASEQCVTATTTPAFHGLPRDATVLLDFQQVPFFLGLEQAPIFHHGRLWQKRAAPSVEEDNPSFLPAVSETHHDEQLDVKSGYGFGGGSCIQDNSCVAVLPALPKNYNSKPLLPYSNKVVADICARNEHLCQLEVWPVPDEQNNIGELVTEWDQTSRKLHNSHWNEIF